MSTDASSTSFLGSPSTWRRRYRVATVSLNSAALWFALQTYYAAVVRLLVRRFVSWDVDDLPDGNPFRWCFSADARTVIQQVERLTAAMDDYDVAAHSTAEGDVLKALYHDLFPRRLRHRLGEYYTPDWLARHVLDQVGFSGRAGQRVLDPACGSGTFLVLALQRLREDKLGIRDWGLGIRDWGLEIRCLPSPRTDRRLVGRGGGGEGVRGRCCSNCQTINAVSPHPSPLPQGEGTPAPRPSPPAPRLSSLAPRPSLLAPCPSPLALHPTPLFGVVGCDLNPLAVLTARANYVIALHDLLPRDDPVEIPVYLADSILDPPRQPVFAEPFDFVVGNPPWIAWDNLSAEYRRASQPLWRQYGLFSLSGNDARHGGGKKDLAMLMLYASADRYLATGGRLGMVIPQTLFQTNGAGDGFRRFRLGPEGEPLKVLRVDDMTALRPFEDAANRTSTITLEKGSPTEYPVPYFIWDKGRKAERGKREAESGGQKAEGGKREAENAQTTAFSCDTEGSASLPRQACCARPIDPARPGSPWLVQPQGVNPGCRWKAARPITRPTSAPTAAAPTACIGWR